MERRIATHLTFRFDVQIVPATVVHSVCALLVACHAVFTLRTAHKSGEQVTPVIPYAGLLLVLYQCLLTSFPQFGCDDSRGRYLYLLIVGCGDVKAFAVLAPRLRLAPYCKPLVNRIADDSLYSGRRPPAAAF